MKREIAGGSVRTTSYIPQQFAKLGSVLRLKDKHKKWTNGWVVESIGDCVVEGDRVPDYRKAIRNHRKSTGDSNPQLGC